jgi:hypothetical protein
MSMNKFKKAAVVMAVAGALAAPTANAVNIAEDGLGDYIYSPLYDARNGNQTYIEVINTSEETVVFKIRFREAYNSRDVRDFNVTLSPFDVWTATVRNNDGVARVETTDRSCTSPLQIRDQELMSGMDPNDFTNAAYLGDGLGRGLGRTLMGYFEIINMGQDSETVGVDNDTRIAAAALHVDGEPSCAGIDGSVFGWLAPNFGDYQFFGEPENSLKVNVSVLDTNSGIGYAVPVTTLANFFNPARSAQDQVSAQNLIREPASVFPNARDVNPSVSNVSSSVAGMGVASAWNTSPEAADPVSALIMRTNAINQFRVGDGVDTDWVVTFPTKNYYTDTPAGNDGYVFPYDLNSGGVTENCVQVGFNFWDDEEATVVQAPGVVPPSPYVPPAQSVYRLCSEVNVLRFGEGVVTTWQPGDDYALADLAGNDIVPFDAGWMRLDFGTVDRNRKIWNGYDMKDDVSRTYEGLPVIGFAVQANRGDGMAWGSAWEHSYGRSIIERTAAGRVQLGNNPAYGDDLGTLSVGNPAPY